MSRSRNHSSTRLARTQSRPRGSRNSSQASISYNPQEVLLPGGAVDQETVELLHEFVHPHHHGEPTIVEEVTADSASDQGSIQQRQQLPWYKRPSPIWFLAMSPFSMAATMATAAPKIEIITQIACEVHKPEYTIGEGSVWNLDKRLCATDPVVQAATARIMMITATTLGILSCLTTAWWSSLSDRYGRTRILGIAGLGILWTDAVFISVVKYYKSLPGGYWAFLAAPAVDGMLGGMATLSAGVHAYLADCTNAESRSRAFSSFLGLIFIGVGLGPTMGSVIIHYTGTPLSVFYVSAAAHVLYLFLVWCVIPESLSKRRQLEARRVHQEELEEAKRVPPGPRWAAWLKWMTGFLNPLAIFYPVRLGEVSPLKPVKRDWSLLLVGIGYACVFSIMGSYAYKFQYTSAIFGWTSEEIGYWLSIVGATRAVHLAIIFPLIVKYLKPKPPAIQLPLEDLEPLQPDNASLNQTQETTEPASSQTSLQTLLFELNLARVSIMIEAVIYIFIPMTRNPLIYLVLTVLGAFGGGFGPSIQSVALGLYTLRGGKESGKLFGALSVVQSLSSSIISPAVYGLLYINTVSFFPGAIFCLSAASVVMALICILFVRLPIANQDLEGSTPAEAQRVEREETLVEPHVPQVVVEGPSKSNTPQL